MKSIYRVLGLGLLALLTALPPLLLVPPTAKPDEAAHWAYAVHLAQTGALPPYVSPDDAASREANQPPLYYGLAAAVSRLTDDPAAFAERAVNPFLLATGRGNRHVWLLSPDAARLFSIGRTISLLFWLLVPLATLWAWQPVLGPSTSAGVAAFMSLVPLLPFIGSAYSNDMLSVLLIVVAFGTSIRLFDAGTAVGWRWAALLGLALGLSLLTKLYAIPLVAALALLAVAPFVRLHPTRRIQLLAAVTLATAMLLPWIWANLQRFGDPLGFAVSRHVMGYDPQGLRVDKVLVVAGQSWRTYWADLGPGGVDSLSLPAALALGLLELAALAGFIRRVRRSPLHPLALFLILWVSVTLALLGWTFLRSGVMIISGGRNAIYLHLVNAPLLMLGLHEWFGSARAARRFVIGIGLLLTIWAWGYLLTTYPPVLREPLNEQAAPQASFGSAYVLLDADVRPTDDGLAVRFAVAKVAPDDVQLAYFVQVVSPAGELLANLNTYPAYGALSSVYWPVGSTVRECYQLPLPTSAPPDSRVLIGLWQPLTGARMPAFDPLGHPLADDAVALPVPSP